MVGGVCAIDSWGDRFSFRIISQMNSGILGEIHQLWIGLYVLLKV
jgi:hypothetical protein